MDNLNSKVSVPEEKPSIGKNPGSGTGNTGGGFSGQGSPVKTPVSENGKGMPSGIISGKI